MSITSDSLYQLLPAIVRQRDDERGNPLAALFRVLAAQGKIVEDDLDRLHDNLFIETCDEWAVRYIGDLLDVRGLHETGVPGFSQRARVANTLAYRRRKGTAAMLEQLAYDTTGWRARAVEFFELLATTQWLNHLRLHSLHVPDLRNGEALDRLGTAFETTRHFVDVRRIASDRGRYNVRNLGLWLWRLQSDHLGDVNARAAPDGGVAAASGRFFVHPLGIDAPLFNRPQTETEITTLASEHNVPGVLRRRALAAELEARRLALVNGDLVPDAWFGREAVFAVSYQLTAGGAFTIVPPEELLIADLSAPAPAVPQVWLRPPDRLTYTRARDGASVDMPIRLALDPVLGRIAFPVGVVPVQVRVSSAHGVPGDAGGGAYDRSEMVIGSSSAAAGSPAPFPLAEVTWQAAVGRDLVANAAAGLFVSFEAAVAAWNAAPAGTIGVIALVDNGTYDHGGVRIHLAPGSRLLIVSAAWPEHALAGGGTRRVLGEVTPSGLRAHLRGSMEVESDLGAELWIDGILGEGSLELLDTGGGSLSRLRVANCTFSEAPTSLTVGDDHDELVIEVLRTLMRGIVVQAEIRSLRIVDSALDGGAADAPALAAPHAAAEIEGGTIVGTTAVQQMEASNTVFTGQVDVERRQAGCVRFSFVPDGSSTPRRYRCQPDLALADAVSPGATQAVLDRMMPDFTADEIGAPAYLQLTRTTPLEIRAGGDGGLEMGVWGFLRQPQREANLRASLDEYLRLGLEAGLIFVT